MHNRNIFIDPPTIDYYQDNLFDGQNAYLNRDNALNIYIYLREFLRKQGDQCHTADYLLGQEDSSSNIPAEYYSLGNLENYKAFCNLKNINLNCFIVLEPPAVAPHLYRALPELTKHFERVYVHNTVGDGYSLKGVNQSKLRSFFWPQPYADVLELHWNNQDRKKRIVVINGNHIPRSFKNQLYSKRITAMASLAKLGIVDLYGRGWDKWWSHRSMWPPYWFNYKTLMSIYRGACDSKYAVLSQYSFSLCFENMVMKGYVTEKIFDCLYAGTIPLYLGAKDIESLIPPEAYIDCRQFSSWSEMGEAVMAMTDAEILKMKDAGKAFIQSDRYLNYYNSLINIFKD